MSPSADKPSDPVKAVRRLIAEIDRLTKQQADLLRVATRIGMTPDEAKRYESWQTELLKRVEELRQLELALSSQSHFTAGVGHGGQKTQSGKS